MKRHQQGHGGTNSIDYFAYTSHLRKVNSGLKTIASVSALLLCITADNIWVSAYVIVTMACITVFFGKLPFRTYVSFLMIPLLFMVMGSIALAFDFGRLPSGDWNLHLPYFYICVAKKGLLRTGLLMGKALGAVSAMYMLTLSTPANELIIVLRKAHIPKLVVELMNMIYRFSFILLDVQCKMHHAAEARLGYVDYRTSVKTFGSTAGNLLILSLKKANLYYDALESRGYEGELFFLEEQKACKSKQVIAVFFYLVLLIFLWTVTR